MVHGCLQINIHQSLTGLLTVKLIQIGIWREPYQKVLNPWELNHLELVMYISKWVNHQTRVIICRTPQ